MDIFVCNSEISGAPDTIKLLPLGEVTSQKGHFIMDAVGFKLMKQEFVRRGVDIVVDYEHQTLKDVQAPAGGWIKDIFIEGDALVAKVEWTPAAQQYIKNREYRYLSPVVLARKSDNRAFALHSVALTNTPAVDHMYPIINSLSLADYEGGNDMDFLKKLAELLGLGADADEAQVLAALKKALEATQPPPSDEKLVANKVVCELLGLQAGAKTEDAAAAIMALKAPPTVGMVSEADFKRLKDSIDKRNADDAVLLAMKAGKVTTFQKDWATEYALKDPSGFTAFVSKAPVVVPMGELGGDPPPKSNALDDTSLLVCKQLGLRDDDLKQYGKAGQ